MGRFSSGSEAANYIYETVIPKVKTCAKGLTAVSKKERLAAQIDCVMSALISRFALLVAKSVRSESFY